MSNNLAFVMDPMERVQTATDTSFAFMLEAQGRGYRVLHVHPHDVHLRGDQVSLNASHVEVADQQGEHFRVVSKADIEATQCDAIFVRTDPPFDQGYLTVTWMLSFAERQGVVVINSTTGLRTANEKLFAFEFPELCPRTIVSASKAEIQSFIETVPEAVIKPLDGHGGSGVLRLRPGDSNVSAIIDLLTAEAREPVMVQEYLAQGEKGDRRLFFVNGELRAVMARIPPKNDHRSNVHIGGEVAAAAISDDDRIIADAMGKRLRELGLVFVGLDVIAGKLIEVNVTSPTLVRELKALGGPDLSIEVIDWVQSLQRDR